MALAAVLAVGTTTDGAVGSGALVDSPFALLLAAVVGYLLGAWTTVPTAVSGVVLTAAAFTFANQRQFPGDYPVVDDLVFYLLLVGAPAVVGASFVARARQVRELTALSDQLAVQRARDLEAARLEEQQRIELAVHHRIVEQMGAIALRADGARHVGDPGSRHHALGEVEELARSGLESLRAAIGLLRDDAAETEQGTPDTPGVRRPSVPTVGWRVVALPAGLGAAMAVESVVGAAAHGPAVANVLASLAVVAPLAARRHHPLLAAAGAMLLAAGMSSRLTPPSEMVTGIALLLVTSYAVGSHSRGWSRLAGLGTLWAGCLAAELARPGNQPADGLLPMMVWCALAVAAGMLGAGWSERAHRMREIIEELERSRETELRVAVARQRQVMARDLHDSVAHTLTVVCLNAGAARRVADADTDAALATVVTASRRGVAELRDGLDELVPPEAALQPRTVEAMARDLGVTLSLDVPAHLSLDGATATLLHRLLREVVVNAARHAPGATVIARVEHRGDRLLLDVTDDGPGAATPGFLGTGTGLASLAAQVRECGGQFDHGPVATGGFGVRARLPAGSLADDVGASR